MPMVVGRNKISTFSFLSERVEEKLQGWQNQTISKAGKMTLIKTAAQVIPNFWMSMFLIPMEVCDRIEKSMNAYWWGNGKANKGIHWMSWERLCAVKEEGGLGFKSLRSFNIAMLAKQAWRIVSNENPLVTSLMRARYFPKSDFLNAKIGTNPSYVWRSILETQDVIRQGCRRRIGDGKNTRIWQIPWLPCAENGYLTTDMPESLKDATVQGLFAESQDSWDEEILKDLFNERDGMLIKQIPIPRRRREDSWLWLFDDKGKFTVRSCYRKLKGESACLNGAFWRKLWGLKLPGKVVNLMWRACRGCLPTVSALARKNVNVQTWCNWCRINEETDVHVLFSCSFAQEVWGSMGLSTLISVQPNDTVLDVMKRVFQIGKHDQILMVVLLCWNIWQRRNTWVWQHINMSSFGVRAKASNMLIDWQRAREEQRVSESRQSTVNRRWCKPPAGWVKINTDACLVDSNKVGVAVVIRDEKGSFLRARSNVIQGNFQPREAEAMGLKEALAWTKNWRQSRCIFECDAKLVVDAVNGEGGNSYFHTIIEDCVDFIKHFDEVLVVFVHRSANTTAHNLARVAYSMSGLTEWLSVAPDFIVCNLMSDEV